MIDLDDIIMITNEVRPLGGRWSPPGKDRAGPWTGQDFSLFRERKVIGWKQRHVERKE